MSELKPIAYAIYGIGGGKHYLKDVKPIPADDVTEEWRGDDYFLGDYWAGNEPLFLASTQPEAPKDDSLRTSLADLAMALWRTHYRNDSPNFELLPDPAGILSQIDNMVSGLVKPEATKPAQDLGAAKRIDLGHGSYIEFERKTSGASGWLLRNEGGHLVRALSATEVLLVDAAIASSLISTVAAMPEVRDWISRVCQAVRDDVAERKRTGENEKFYTFTLNEMTHLLPILLRALASPADALEAGDRVDARKAVFAAYSHCLANGNSMLPQEIADHLIAAIQAQKDGHV